MRYSVRIILVLIPQRKVRGTGKRNLELNGIILSGVHLCFCIVVVIVVVVIAVVIVVVVVMIDVLYIESNIFTFPQKEIFNSFTQRPV